MIRATVAALAVALFVLPLPFVAAQEPDLLVLEDKKGDVKLIAAGNMVGDPGGRFPANDLVALRVEETPDSFIVRLEVADLAAAGETPLESTVYFVDFSHGGMTYRVLFYRQAGQTPQYGGQLEVYDPGQDDYGGGQRLTVTADPAHNVIEAAVPRDVLLDEMGAAPFPGRVLDGFRASSASIGWRNEPLCFPVASCTPVPQTAVIDAMPDSGAGDVDVPVKLGLAQSGYARLASQTPVRASNGEATTFLFEVLAANLDANLHRFALAAVGVPANWQVHLPSDLVELDANMASVLPILVTTPFGHNHGTFQDFRVEMTSLDDPNAVGRVQLGVRYMATPQPAGHHNQLYLHAAKATGDQTFDDLGATIFGFDPQHLYFNTLTPDEDDNDAKEPVGGSAVRDSDFPPSVPSTVPSAKYTWNVPLSPGLAMGLDFDPTVTGTIRVLVDSIMPLPGAVLDGRIIHVIPIPCDSDDEDCNEGQGQGQSQSRGGIRTTAANLLPSKAVEVSANAQGVAFETTIQATPEGDYLSFEAGATLTLQLNLTFARPDPTFGPHDIPKVSGGMMTLPLLEYHDPVDQVFSSMAGLMIHVEGAQQRLANAGDTAVFDLALMNHADAGASYHLELSGPGTEWAEILGDVHITVAAGETRPLAIAVRVPKASAEGDMADLILTAVDAADPTQRTLARLVVIVDEGADHPDDSARIKALDDQLTDKKVPGLALPAIAGLIALAALLGRRRRL